MTPTKQWFAENGNADDRRGGVQEALDGADVLLGLPGPGVIHAEWLLAMADDAIVFAMANPINNVLAFRGVFRGMLDVQATRCTIEMKHAASDALASLVSEPTADRVTPPTYSNPVLPKRWPMRSERKQRSWATSGADSFECIQALRGSVPVTNPAE